MRNWIVGFALGAVAMVTMAGTVSPYAGEESRPIKALSPQQIDDYLQGRGLGYAKAAELNHYPGPRHVLELADELELTPQQISRSTAIFESMQAQAAALGRQFVAQEQALDRAFADGAIDPESLRTRVAELGALEAQIRYAHLAAHLEQKPVLSEHQLRLYDQLRGYGPGQRHQHDHVH